MLDARKHIALVVVNLRPGMDGGSSAMLELMHYVSRVGYQASIFNFLTSEPYYRTFLEERIASRGSGLTVSRNEIYRYREGEIDCQVRFLPCTIQELQLDRAPFLKAVAETLSKLQVNYVLTAERISVLAAHLLAMPGCHFFHSLGNIKRIQGMHPAYLSSVLRRETAAVSSFLRGKAKELLGVEATVLHPGIDLTAYVTPRDAQADAIGFYACGIRRYKGDEIVNAIITMMPEHKFLIVGGSYHHEFADFPANLTYSGYQPDMRDFYRQVKVLLVPSLVPEGFPRMILEAAANGIPVIANHIGGIPEALGNGGILIELDVTRKLDVRNLAHRYVAALRRLLDDEDEYRTMSNKALLRGRQYESQLEHDLHLFFQKHVQ